MYPSCNKACRSSVKFVRFATYNGLISQVGSCKQGVIGLQYLETVPPIVWLVTIPPINKVCTNGIYSTLTGKQMKISCTVNTRSFRINQFLVTNHLALVRIITNLPP